MINYIICDDNKEINKKICNIIDKIMMANKKAYKKHTFLDYDSSFNKTLEKDLTNKIYLLDIETPSASGIDVARKIRENDIDSIIIFITSHNELGSILLKDELMFLTFICKFDDMDGRLDSAIRNALKMIGVRLALSFNDHAISYTIPLNSIYYLTTDTINRKTVIVTDNNKFYVSKPLNELVELLDDRFKQTHRACYINMDKVISINKSKKEILFDNSIKIDLLSNSFKKGLNNNE